MVGERNSKNTNPCWVDKVTWSETMWRDSRLVKWIAAHGPLRTLASCTFICLLVLAVGGEAPRRRVGRAKHVSRDFSPWSCSGKPTQKTDKYRRNHLNIPPSKQLMLELAKPPASLAGMIVVVKDFARLAILCAGPASTPFNHFFVVLLTYTAHLPSVQVWVFCSVWLESLDNSPMKTRSTC